MSKAAPFIATHRTAFSFLLTAVAGWPLGGCIDATNPYDPETPLELQAKASLRGSVVLDAVSTDPGTLRAEIESVRIGLLDQTGARLKRDGAPVALALGEPTVDAGVARGSFTFDALTPGTYSLVVDNVASFYQKPALASVRVVSGAAADAGELRFVFTADGGGPGVIRGEVDAPGAGQQIVTLYQLRSDGVRLIDSALTAGDFSFAGLAIGSYALVAEADGFTPDFRVDVHIGEGGDAQLVHDFSVASALTLFPVSAVLVPALDGGARLDDGSFFVSSDAVAMQVLAFGGVTGMRLSTNVDLTDDNGAPLPYVPFAAATTVALPAREGVIEIFAQFEAASAGGFLFSSEVFSTRLVRDVSAPTLLDGTGVRGLFVDGQGRLVTNGGAVAVDVDAQDAISAIDAVAVTVDPADPDEALVFSDVTAANGRVLLQVPAVLSGDGEHTIVVAVRDRAGNEGERRVLTVLLDAAAPLVQVTIAGGAASTRAAAAQLTVDATDASPVTDMEISTTGSFAGTFVPFNALTTVDLGNVDGPRTVDVRVRDAAGNVGTGSASITLDRVAPTATLVLAGGAAATRTQTVAASLAFEQPDTTELLVSTTPQDCTSATLEAAAASPLSTAVDLGQGDGTKTVFACVRDLAGNTRQVQDDVVLDTTPPPSSIALDGGATHTLDATVDIVVTTSGDASAAVFSTSGLDCDTATYAAFTAGSTPTISLPLGSAPEDGTRTVNACFRDAAGNTSAASDSIILDRFDPSGTLSVEGGALFARSRTVSVDIATSIDVVGVAIDALPLDCSTVSYQGFSTPRIITLADSDGTQTVRTCVKDGAGRTALLTDDIVLDRAPPLGTVVINGGADVTTARTVTTQLSYDADSTLVLASAVPVDCATAQGYLPATPPSSTVAVDLLGGRGLQPVFGCFKDAAGNTSQASDTIFFDESDTTGLIVAINGGAQFATNRSVLVTLMAPSDTTEAKLVEGGTLDCDSPVGYAPFNPSSPLPLTLSGGAAPFEGARTVSACVRQGAAVPLFAQDSIVLDTFAPTGTLALNSGAAATSSLQVIVTLSAATDVTSVSLTSAPTIDCTSVTYEAFTANKAFALAGPDGTNTVRACLRDAAGNTAQVSDSITLDRVGPSPVSVSLPAFVTTNAATATLSFPAGDTAAVAAAEGSLDCATTPAYVPAAGSVVVPLSAQDGTKNIVACFRDAAGNTSQAAAQTVLDTADPIGTVTINSGALFSTSTDLTLTLTAPADAAQMSIAEGTNDCATAPYVPFVAQPNFTVSATQGTKTVVVCLRDLAGRTASAQDTITLDTQSPSGTLTINGGAANTRDRNVVVSVTPGGGFTDVQDMAVADGATLACASATYVAFATATPHQLPSGDGTKQLAACLRDRAGNVSTASFSSSIVLDETPPNAGNASLTIAGGAAFTTIASVSLTLTFPSDVTQRAIANDGLDCASATYVAAGSSPATIAGHALTTGDGSKLTVACVKDAAGNTFLVSDSITLDTTPPTGTIVLASGAAFSTSASTAAAFTKPDDTSLAFVQAGGSAPTCSAVADASYVALPSVIALGADGPKTVFACFRDAAGNKSTAAVSSTITLDTTVPTVSSFTAPTLTNTQVVSLTIEASDTNAPLQMALGNNALNCATASYAAFASPTQHTILSAASTTVHLCVKDAAGNTTATNGNTVTVSLDTTPPAAPVVAIQDGGDGFITSAGATTVQLNWSTAGDVAAIKAAEGAIDCAQAAGYTAVGAVSTTTVSVSTSSGDGTKTVIACFKDAAGNIATASDQTILDSQPPTGTLVVAGDAPKTRLTSAVPVTVTSSSSDVTQMAIIDMTAGSGQTCATAAYVSFAASGTLAAFASATNASKTVGVCFRDQAGNQSSAPAATDSITLDTTLVTTGITLSMLGVKKDGALDDALTRVPVVTLTLGGAAADVVGIEIANDSSFAGAAQDIYGNGVVYPVLLDPGDGVKDVFVRLTDDAGNTVTLQNGNPASIDLLITLDTQAPSAPVALLKSGDTFSNTATVPITLTAQTNGAQDGTLEVRVSVNDADFDDAGETFSPTVPATVTLPGIDGAKNVFAQFRDEAGNESPVVSDSIILDRTAPAPVADIPCPSASQAVCINAGQAFTSSVSVTVELTSSVANGVATEMQVATDGTADTEPFIPYSNFVTALLSSTQGTKTVAVRFRDAAGNTSASFTDTIDLDTTPPTAPRIANAARVTKASTETVSLSVGAVDAFTVTYQLVGGQFTDWTSVGGVDNFVFSLTNPPSASAEAGDVYTLGVRAVDPAGNVSAEDFVTVTCDANAPSTPENVTVAERSGSVSLRWDRPAATESDVVGYLVFYGYNTTSLDDDFAAQGPSPVFVPLPSGAAQPTLTLTGLSDNTPFHIRLRAIDHASAPDGVPNASDQTEDIVVLPNEVAPVVVGGLARTAGGSNRIYARGGRVYAMEGNQLCVYDVSDPAFPTRIVCKSDAAIDAADALTVFGRFAYLHRTGQATRVVDVGRLGGSARSNPASVPVQSIDASTTGAVDMMFTGTASGIGTIGVLITNGGMTALQRPGAAGLFSPDLASSGGFPTFPGATPVAVDASPELTAIALRKPGGDEMVVQTPGNSRTQTFSQGELIRDVHVDTIGDGSPVGAGRVFAAGSFGLRVFTADTTAGVSLTQRASLGGFDCTHIESAAGYVYCNDVSAGSADTLVVVALAPSPHVVGRLLIDNTKAPGSTSPAQIAGFTLTENTLYAILTDVDATLVAIEIAKPARYTSAGSTGTNFDDLVVDGTMAAAFEVSGSDLRASVFDITDPTSLRAGKTVTSPALITGCSSTPLTKRSRAQVFGRVPAGMCADGTTAALATFAPRTNELGRRTRSGADPSRSRSMVIDGATAYVLTDDAQLEAWDLTGSSPTGVDLVVNVTGGGSFSRPPAVQDDRLVFVNDAGDVFVASTTSVPTATPAISVSAAQATAALDVTRFGDVELRGNRVLVSRALSVAADAGLFSIPFDPASGALNVVATTTRPRGFGAIAPAGDVFIVSDGAVVAGAPGNVAGLLTLSSGLMIKTSTQAVLAPFGVVVAGPVLLSTNRDSGVEVLFLSR